MQNIDLLIQKPKVTIYRPEDFSCPIEPIAQQALVLTGPAKTKCLLEAIQERIRYAVRALVNPMVQGQYKLTLKKELSEAIDFQLELMEA